mmetsp:Transcript_26299/g.36655  ORF Transcript_26299/g.36655 Transcript_26299/m.36655 type:complete len:256 (+) Transcript_26299:1174-1941(+)
METRTDTPTEATDKAITRATLHMGDILAMGRDNRGSKGIKGSNNMVARKEATISSREARVPAHRAKANQLEVVRTNLMANLAIIRELKARTELKILTSKGMGNTDTEDTPGIPKATATDTPDTASTPSMGNTSSNREAKGEGKAIQSHSNRALHHKDQVIPAILLLRKLLQALRRLQGRLHLVLKLEAQRGPLEPNLPTSVSALKQKSFLYGSSTATIKLELPFYPIITWLNEEGTAVACWLFEATALHFLVHIS